MVAAAARQADSTVFYDSSAISGPRIVAQLTTGVPIGRVAWPAWASDPLPLLWPDSALRAPCANLLIVHTGARARAEMGLKPP